jgi:hypothetical protein
MVLYFIFTVFLSATLLFSVQPMVAKTLLPVFGGSSSVWTTCMLFYQTVLLLGYLYAHFVMKHVSRRAQLFGHIAMLIVALIAGILFDTPEAPRDASAFPVPWLILQLALVSGLPFFMISSAGPLVQGWFARTGHARSHDPYFLYAASNAGSFLGLLAYPFVIEPMLGLDVQRSFWLGGFAVFIVMSFGAIMMTRKGAHDDPHAPPAEVLAPPVDEEETQSVERPITWSRRLRWTFYAFVPSSMLLGVTSHITIDVASFPLLWVLPLAVYLMTMIVAFAVDAGKFVEIIRRPMVISVIGATVLVLAAEAQTYAPLPALVAVQLILLGLVGLTGHGLLAKDRPGAVHLTEFYLIMSVGGALGGMFNGIVAPLVFETTLEYQIMLLCAVSLIPWRNIKAIADNKKQKKAMLLRYGLPIASLVYMLLMAVFVTDVVEFINIPIPDRPLALFALMVFVPAVLIYLAWNDGLACMLVLAVPLSASVYDKFTDPRVQYRSRTFYGVLNVVDENFFDPELEEILTVRTLMHGTTNHGVQFLDDRFKDVPLGYYHIQGPCGMGIRALKETKPDGARIGIVGLGSGAITAHGRLNDKMRYFEIDPEVASIAQDPEYFTYLSDAQFPVDVALGDGRLLLEQERRDGEALYDMVLIDAFSSDAIPVHLLTEEAMQLYFDRLTDDGIILLHVSNRHLEFQPLVYELGALHNAFVLMYEQQRDEIPDHLEDYWFPSVWIALTLEESTAQALYDTGMNPQIEPKFDVRLWTDQYSNILKLFQK